MGTTAISNTHDSTTARANNNPNVKDEKDDPDLFTTLIAPIFIITGVVLFVVSIVVASICFLKKKQMQKLPMAIPNLDYGDNDIDVEIDYGDSDVDVVTPDDKTLNARTTYNDQNYRRNTAGSTQSYYQGTYRNSSSESPSRNYSQYNQPGNRTYSQYNQPVSKRKNDYVDAVEGRDEYVSTPAHARTERNGSLHLLDPSASPGVDVCELPSPGGGLLYLDGDGDEGYDA